MVVDIICWTTIDYLYPTIAPEPGLLLNVWHYLINLEQIARGFPAHLLVLGIGSEVFLVILPV